MKSTSTVARAPSAAEADAGTRERVAASMLEHGPSTAAALAGRLGLTPAAIRRHLDVLVDGGHAGAREQRTYGARGRGRPARVFFLTDSGRARFYSDYDTLAVQALEFLAERNGPAAVDAFARSRADGLRAPLDRTEHAPVQALAGTLTDQGYAATVRPTPGGAQLCQHHCPVAHVAERFPQLCDAETQMFSELLGVHVQRLATIAHGDGVCTTHVPRTVAANKAAVSSNTPTTGTTTVPHVLTLTNDPTARSRND